MHTLPLDSLVMTYVSLLSSTVLCVQDVTAYFVNSLPHPSLALLVFAEFTSVDAAP